MRFILASASARRRDLCEQAGLDFRVLPADIPEEPRLGESPGGLVERLACEKAQWVSNQCPGEVVIGADTIVYLGAEVLGKPVDLDEARSMLLRLSLSKSLTDSGTSSTCSSSWPKYFFPCNFRLS